VQTRDIPALDGVRGLAILLVVLCHSAYFLSWPGPHALRPLEEFAYSGVDLFFVLSGFLLFLPYAQALLRGTSWPSWQQFYRRRLRRILPAYYVFIFLPLAVLLLDMQHPVRTALAFLASVTLFYDWNAVAWKTLVTNYDGPLWSLTIEMQFYAILPWLAIGMGWFSKGRVRRVLLALCIIIAYGLGVRAVASVAQISWHWPVPLAPPIYGMNGKYLEAFALGMAVAVLYTLPVRVSSNVHWLLVGLLLVGLAICLMWRFEALGRPGNASLAVVWQIFGDWAVCCCYACLLFVVMVSQQIAWLFTLSPMRFLGRISYSMYLWHNPVLLLLLTHHQTIARLGLAWMVTLALSCASYFGVERPFLRARKRSSIRVSASG
jgi:peptidoglycan/LPS O-acetylase OafA/YrhL